MTLQIENFDGAVALDDVQQLQGALGTGVTSGCAPSLPSSTSPITIDVASGTAYVSNSEVNFGGGSVQLPDGDSQHPRKDVVYVTSMGTLDSVQGTPRAPKDGTGNPGTDRTVYQPEPPDLSSLSSVADAAVVCEVWVPAGATATSDMTDSGVTYVSDRRLRPWASALQLAADDPPTHATTHESGGSDTITPSNLSGFDSDVQTAINNDGDHGSTASHNYRTDEEIRDASGAMATDGLTYDDANDELGLNVVATGSVALSGGTASVDTGVASTTTATFTVFLGPDTDDANVAADITAVSGGNYEVDIEETDTSVGNPTIEYDIVRLR